MERWNTKLLTITDWSRKQNLSGRQAEKTSLELHQFRGTQLWRVVCPRRTNRLPHAYLSTLKQGSRDEATIQNEFLGYNFNGKIKNKISRDHESEQTTKFTPSSKTSLELHQFRGTQVWRVVCPRRTNRLSHWHTSPHSNKVLETKQNNLKRVLRFWWCGEDAAPSFKSSRCQ